MKLASGGHLEQLDTASFFEQGQEYDESGDMRESVLRLMIVETQSHPFAVVRAKELRRWVDSGAYTQVLAGNYPRREDDATADISAAATRGGGELHRAVPWSLRRARQVRP